MNSQENAGTEWTCWLIPETVARDMFVPGSVGVGRCRYIGVGVGVGRWR